MTTLDKTFLILLTLALALQIPLLHVRPVNEDVNLITSPTRTLVETGSLKNIGVFVAYQALRDGFTGAQPYWFEYFGPVALLAPFFKIFGASDFSYYLQQSVLWLLLFGLLYRYFAHFGTAVFFSLLIHYFGVLNGSWYESPTQAPALLSLVVLWKWFGENKFGRRDALRTGLVGGLGALFRPEALGLLALYWILGGPLRQSPKEKWKNGAACFGVVAGVLVLANLVRSALGATGGEDHRFFIVGTEVFAEGFGTLSFEQSFPLSHLFSDRDLLLKLAAKLARKAYGFITLNSGVWTRREAILIFFLPFGLVKTSTRKVYLLLTLLLLFQVGLTGLTLDTPRYFDGFFLLLLLQIFRDTDPGKVLRGLPPPLRVGLATALLVLATWRVVKDVRAVQRHDVAFAARIALLQRAIPPSAFVITDNVPLWQWYAGGKIACVAPGRPATLTALLKKFPDAYVLLESVPGRIGEAALALNTRTLRKSTVGDALVYAPTK